MGKKKIAILCFSDYVKEPRVIRTIQALQYEYRIHVFSPGKNTMNSIEFTNIEPCIYEKILPNFHASWPRLLQKAINAYLKFFVEKRYSDNSFYLNKYWTNARVKLKKTINEQKFDLVICHGIETLPVIAELNGPIKVFNAHEYYLREFEENPNWLKYTQPYYRFILESYIRKIDLMFCVCQTIQEQYIKDYQLNSVIITNARDFANVQIKKREDDLVKLVHHGAAIKGRNLEKTINVIDFLPANYELNLVLIPTEPEYYNDLKIKYSINKKIKFLDPVNIEEIPAFISYFDIGLYILPPTNYNNMAALPNKFFDFIQGCLCLAVSPNTEMKRLVEKHGLGIVSTDFSSETMADMIMQLSTDQINSYKTNACKNSETLSSLETKKEMLYQINNLLAG